MAKNEQTFSDKCDQSYRICLEELKNPVDDWENIIHSVRFTVDPVTMQPKTSYEFELDKPDNINVPGPQQHTYIFKRSRFYEKFKIPQSRLYKDLVTYYKNLGFFVDLYYDENRKWKLKLSWINDEIKPPNVVIRKPF